MEEASWVAPGWVEARAGTAAEWENPRCLATVRRTADAAAAGEASERLRHLWKVKHNYSFLMYPKKLPPVT